MYPAVRQSVCYMLYTSVYSWLPCRTPSVRPILAVQTCCTLRTTLRTPTITPAAHRQPGPTDEDNRSRHRQIDQGQTAVHCVNPYNTGQSVLNRAIPLCFPHGLCQSVDYCCPWYIVVILGPTAVWYSPASLVNTVNNPAQSPPNPTAAALRTLFYPLYTDDSRTPNV